MKIDKTNPKHLLLLAMTLINIVSVMFVRMLWGRGKRPKRIIFYGHTLNGNLKAFFDYMNNREGYAPYFLCLNRDYRDKLINEGIRESCILVATSPRCISKIASAEAFVTSHGAHFFSILKRATSIRFIDVWHGIPYKGFDADDLGFLHDYDGVFVSSPEMKKMYIDKFGFSSKNLTVTGYGRVDQLINNTLDKQKIIDKYKIPLAKKYVLIAPTWQQDDRGRSELPFGVSAKKFFNAINEVAKENNAIAIFRTHLNSSNSFVPQGLRNTLFMPYAQYEIAEDFLFIADVLITDWSSIAFDFLPLNRPTIFLDVPAPFKKGFSFGPEYRFGDVVEDLVALSSSIERGLQKPREYVKGHKAEIQRSKEAAYGSTLDGRATERYLKTLESLLESA